MHNNFFSMYFAGSCNYGRQKHLSVQFLQSFFRTCVLFIFELLSFWPKINSIRNADGESPSAVHVDPMGESIAAARGKMKEHDAKRRFFLTQSIMRRRMCSIESSKLRGQDIVLFPVLGVSPRMKRSDIFLIPVISMSRKLIRPSVVTGQSSQREAAQLENSISGARNGAQAACCSA